MTAMNLFLAGIVFKTLHGKRRDPHQASEDRRRQIEFVVKTMVLSSIVGTAFLSITLILPALELRDLTPLCQSLFFQLLAVISFRALRPDDINFDVYKEGRWWHDTQPDVDSLDNPGLPDSRQQRLQSGRVRRSRWRVWRLAHDPRPLTRVHGGSGVPT